LLAPTEVFDSTLQVLLFMLQALLGLLSLCPGLSCLVLRRPADSDRFLLGLEQSLLGFRLDPRESLLSPGLRIPELRVLPAKEAGSCDKENGDAAEDPEDDRGAHQQQQQNETRHELGILALL